MITFKIKDNIVSIGITLILIALVIFPKLVALSIILLLLFVLAFLFDKTQNIKVQHKYIFKQYFLTGLFALYLIGLTYSSNINFGIKEIEARLSFIIIPLVFWILFYKRICINIRLVTVVFVLICIISSALSLYKGLTCSNYSEGYLINCLHGSLMAYKIHINYLSIYYFVAILMLWSVFKNSILSIIIKILISSWLLYFIYLFDSLGSWVAIAFTLASLLVYFIFKLKNTRYKIGLLLGCLFMTTFSFYFIYKELEESYQKKYKTIQSKQELYQIANETHESILARIVVWDIAVQEIKTHPFGVGTGDVKDHIIQKYKDNKLDELAEMKLNPHNQYLQTGISIGWMGILVLITLQLSLIVKGFKNNNWLLLSFSILCMINMFFESYLESQAGIVFFSVMIFLLDRMNFQREKL